MPIYEYTCKDKKCKNNGVKIQKTCSIKERNKQKCSVCGKILAKLITKSNLKGVG